MRKNITTVIHDSTTPDLTGTTYITVLSTVTATITVNGSSVDVIPNTKFDIVVGSITGAAGVYLLGYPKHKETSQQIL